MSGSTVIRHRFLIRHVRLPFLVVTLGTLTLYGLH